MKYKIVDNMIVPKKDAKFIKFFIDEEFRREAAFFACLISVVPFAFFIIPMTIYESFTSILGFLFMVSIVPMVCIWIVNRSHQAYLASKRLPIYHNDKRGVVMSAINSDNPLIEEVFEIYFNSDSFRVENKCIEVMSAIMKKDELNKSLTNKGGLKDAEDEIAIDSFLSTVEAMKELNGD